MATGGARVRPPVRIALAAHPAGWLVGGAGRRAGPLTPDAQWPESAMRAQSHRDALRAEASATDELPRPPPRPASPSAAPGSGQARRRVRSASVMRQAVEASKQVYAARRAALRGCD
eukprot:scaffold5953_cov107-Isochrysis_galbana.AAC.2